MTRFKFIIFILSILIYSNSIGTPNAALPIDCQLGVNCWISNLHRHFVNNQEVDFRCGPNTYHDHKGTDFALQDLKSMQEGVAVLAPLAGEIVAIRDGMNDISVKKIGKSKIKGQECGNAVVIISGDWRFQLCHLKKGSLVVKKGDYVSKGQKLSEVGMSGFTEYPHLHLSVRKMSNGSWEEYDPFYGHGLYSCGKKPLDFWEDQTLPKGAKTGIVYNYGFAFEKPDIEGARAGEYRNIRYIDNVKLIVGWVDIFSVDAGDKLKLSLVNNNGDVIVEKTYNFYKYQARYFAYIGKKINQPELLKGAVFKVTYTHSNELSEENYETNLGE